MSDPTGDALRAYVESETFAQKTAALNEYDYTEWRDVARKCAPHLTDEDFMRMWEEFHAGKEAKGRH